MSKPGSKEDFNRLTRFSQKLVDLGDDAEALVTQPDSNTINRCFSLITEYITSGKLPTGITTEEDFYKKVFAEGAPISLKELVKKAPKDVIEQLEKNKGDNATKYVLADLYSFYNVQNKKKNEIQATVTAIMASGTPQDLSFKQYKKNVLKPLLDKTKVTIIKTHLDKFKESVKKTALPTNDTDFIKALETELPKILSAKKPALNTRVGRDPLKEVQESLSPKTVSSEDLTAELQALTAALNALA